jgi:allophanate hydrolase subunit 2
MADDRVPVIPGITLFKKEQVLPLSLIPEWRSEVTMILLPGLIMISFRGAAEILFKSVIRSQITPTEWASDFPVTSMNTSKGADVISYPLAKGTIQVPGDGQP